LGPRTGVDVMEKTFITNGNQTPYHSTRTLVIIPREQAGSVCKLIVTQHKLVSE